MIDAVTVEIPVAGITSIAVQVNSGPAGPAGADGNANIIISATAPEDTTATWRDPEDGIDAFYLGGGWVTQMTSSGAEAVPEDVTAPTLAFSTLTATGATTATGTVTTYEASGTVYAYISTSGTPPAASAVKASGTSQAGGSAGVKTFNFTGLTAETLYSVYYVHTDDAGNDSSVANAADTTSAAATGPSLTLAWDDVATEETSYLVERSPNNATWATLATLAANIETHTDDTVAYNTGYYYRVSATNGAGVDAVLASGLVYSEPESGPLGEAVTLNATTMIVGLIPTDPEPVTGYRLYLNQGSPLLVGTVETGGANQVFVENLESATEYSFFWTAYNDNGANGIKESQTNTPFALSTVALPDNFADLVTELAPVLWYRLTETSGTTLADASGNGLTGTLVDATPTADFLFNLTGADPDGKAVYANGTTGLNAHISAGNPAALQIVGDYTMSCFVNVSAFLNTGDGIQTLMGKGFDGDTEEYVMQFYTNPSNVTVLRAGSYDGVENPTPEYDFTARVGEWVAVAIQNQDGFARLFIDGAEVDFVEAAGAIAGTSPFYIFGENMEGSFSRGIEAQIAEPMVFDYALTPGEIAALHSTPITAP